MPKHEHYDGYDQEFLTRQYEKLASHGCGPMSNLPQTEPPEIDDPLIEDSLRERREIVSALADIWGDFFHYGRNYDSLMDGMVQSPLAVLDCIRHVLEGVEQDEIDGHLQAADPFSDDPPTREAP